MATGISLLHARTIRIGERDFGGKIPKLIYSLGGFGSLSARSRFNPAFIEVCWDWQLIGYIPLLTSKIRTTCP